MIMRTEFKRNLINHPFNSTKKVIQQNHTQTQNLEKTDNDHLCHIQPIAATMYLFFKWAQHSLFQKKLSPSNGEWKFLEYMSNANNKKIMVLSHGVLYTHFSLTVFSGSTTTKQHHFVWFFGYILLTYLSFCVCVFIF